MGLSTLIESFSNVRLHFPDARLWIAGSGPLKEALIRQIDLAQPAGHVKLIGYVPEEALPDYYGAADCTVMPSLDLEGFGLATAESLACGTPVIGSTAGATPELISGLGEHLLFAMGVDALIERFRAILSDPTLLPARSRCRQYAVRRFSWDVPVDAMERHGLEILDEEISR